MVGLGIYFTHVGSIAVSEVCGTLAADSHLQSFPETSSQEYQEIRTQRARHLYEKLSPVEILGKLTSLILPFNNPFSGKKG
jgi:hypothetical protein